MKASSPRSSRRTKVVVAILGAVAVALVAAAGHYWRKERGKEARQLAYQAALRAYSRDLKPGLTRKEVEAYFQTRGAKFEKICCVGQQHSADLVKIGEEDSPWYCGDADFVYLVFEFAAVEPTAGFSVSYLGQDSDVLRTIGLEQRGSDCL
jgi:hypothetical protein